MSKGSRSNPGKVTNDEFGITETTK
jgi:hypothetical protein